MKRADYPDVSDILKRKAEGREALAKLRFVEKVRRMEELRERLAPLARSRSATKTVDTAKTSA